MIGAAQFAVTYGRFATSYGQGPNEASVVLRSIGAGLTHLLSAEALDPALIHARYDGAFSAYVASGGEDPGGKFSAGLRKFEQAARESWEALSVAASSTARLDRSIGASILGLGLGGLYAHESVSAS